MIGGAGEALSACAPSRAPRTATFAPNRPGRSRSTRGRSRSRRQAPRGPSISNPVLPGEPDRVAVAEMPLHALVLARPHHPPKLSTSGQDVPPRAPRQARRWLRSASCRKTSSPPGRSRPMCLGNPLRGIGPDRRAVLGECEVEGRVGQWDLLALASISGNSSRFPPACDGRSRGWAGVTSRPTKGTPHASRAMPRSRRCRSRAR